FHMKPFEHGGNIHKVHRETGLSFDTLIDFSANLNPLGPSPIGTEALKSAIGTLTHYPDPDYVDLRFKLAQFHGAGVLPEHVYPTSGGIEAIYDVVRALKPKKCLIVVPAFVEYERAARAVGAEISHLTLGKDNGFQIDETGFIKSIEREKPDLIMLGSPNNPTGQPVPRKLVEAALSHLAQWNGALMTDEAFMDFLPDEAAWSMTADVTAWANLFIARSLTKFYAVPGLRIGYMLSASERFKSYWQNEKPVWGVNTLAEAYVIAALEDMGYLQETLQTITALRKKLVEKLSHYKEIKVFPGKANFILIEVTGALKSILFEELIKYNIMIRDCSNYAGLRDGFYRLAVLDSEAIQRLDDALGSVFQAQESEPEIETRVSDA
ncbi:MAG: pyridoxal phosphate-dependent class II aminotransferase, partial [Erysipelotrichaceae bacterium]|nr:pyridoxal phosphate-dependent class II aminotransferase [Erysipelotrichaceae bacterium]